MDDAPGQTREGPASLQGKPDEDEIEEGEVEDEPDRPPTAQERDAALRRAGLKPTPSSTETDLINNATQPSTERGQQETSQPAQPATSAADQGKLAPYNAKGAKADYATGTTDQTLENLKMAYYWAGYYSGLYDGQRQSTSKPAP